MKRHRYVVIGTLILGVALLLMACAPAAAPTSGGTSEKSGTQSQPTTAAQPTAAPAAPKATAATAPTPAAGAAAPAGTPALVKVGDLGTSLDAPFYIADKKGYFKEQGLRVEFVHFDSGTQQIAPLGTGELDVGRGALGIGIFNAILRGVDVKIVADSRTSSASVKRDASAFMIRKDLVNEIKSEKDLKGRKIGYAGAAGSSFDVELSMLLQKGGLTEKDVQITAIPHPDAPAALANKSIDAIHALAEPFVTQAEEKGIAVYWKGLSEIYPNHTASGVTYSPVFIKNRPDEAKRFMVAYVKGLRDFYDAFFNNKNRKEITDILTQSTSIKDAALWDKMGLAPVNPDGYVNSEGIDSDAKFFLDRGQITGSIDSKKLVDNSFVDYAISKLGKYQKP